MTALLVKQPGIHTTVQDRGRFGYQAQGVPVSGALDPTMLRLANALVGNAPFEAGLEILLSGPALEVEGASVRVALAAFGGTLAIEGESTRTFPAWRSVTAKKGERVVVKGTGGPVCAYLAIEGGFDLPPVLGSLATYARGKFGGFKGRALQAGDVLPLKRAQASERGEAALADPPREDTTPLRVVPGPQEDLFKSEALDILCASAYTVARNSDRMGLRFEGAELPHARGHDILSDGIASGTIQVPGDRRPVLLVADRQTSGGYPKIATVCTADLPRSGRLKPGDAVRFVAVTVEAAQKLARAEAARIERVAADLVSAGAGEMDVTQLYSANLVSGVVSGEEPDHDKGSRP